MENKVFQKENLKELRSFLNLTFEEMASKIGISSRQLKALESGETKKPNNKTLEKIAKFFDDTFNFASVSGIIYTKETYKNFFFHEYKNRELCIKDLIEIKNNHEVFEQEYEDHQVKIHDNDVIESTAKHWFKDYYKRVELKFPYPYTAKDVFARNPDGSPSWTGADSPVFYKYYEDKLKEEHQVLNALLSNLQKKYNMSDTEIQEIRRKFENVKDLEVFLIYQPDW